VIETRQRRSSGVPVASEDTPATGSFERSTHGSGVARESDLALGIGHRVITPAPTVAVFSRATPATGRAAAVNKSNPLRQFRERESILAREMFSASVRKWKRRGRRRPLVCPRRDLAERRVRERSLELL
jgi:hypothetical protein